MMMSISQYSGDSPRKASMVPIKRNDMTTVRVRTKNNSYVYGESQIDPMNNTERMMDPHEVNMMWQKKKAT